VLKVLASRSANEDDAARQLVARHLSGDPDAFAELVSLFSGRVYNLALRFTGDRAEAEDIAQESFLRAFTALPRSRVELPFRPWLLQIAVNLCRDWARRKRPVPFSDLAAAGDDPADADAAVGAAAVAGGDAGVEGRADSEPSPAEAAETSEQMAALRQAVMALPPAFRIIVTLRYNEDLSYEEIGQLLNMPPATVGTSLLRARRRLRAALTHPGDAGDR
jgi:RNA polymerase sigma-70 factor (ECF subfamily)